MASQASAPQPPSAEVDPISKFKMLIPPLKESLTKLMKTSAQILNQNAQVDGMKTNENQVQNQRLDKSLEEFYALCDQIELSLKLAMECNSQNTDSQRYTPLPVQGAQKTQEPTQGQEIQTYSQYLSTVRMQINCAKEVHDSLLECAKQITERNIVQGPKQAT